jgi:hypothetical protein
MTTSSDFPTQNAYQTGHQGGVEDAFVARLNSAGNALVYSTYLGDSGNGVGNGIAVDSSGYAYVTGYADADDFPTTPDAYQVTHQGGYDAFVAKIDTAASGNTSLVYSTYFGSSDSESGQDIAVDSSGCAYVTGSVGEGDNFPTRNALQTTYGGSNADAFLAKIDTTRSGDDCLVYSTYLGGDAEDRGLGIAVESGYAYITGTT